MAVFVFVLVRVYGDGGVCFAARKCVSRFDPDVASPTRKEAHVGEASQ